MGKKRSKKTPKPANVETSAPEQAMAAEGTSQESLSFEPPAAAPASQPALTEEKAAELVSEPAAAAAPAAEAKVEPEPSQEQTAVASEAAPSTARPKKKKKVVKKKRASHPPAVTRAALDEKIDQLEAKLEVKKEEAAKAAREGFGSNPAIDDTSVPPVDLEIHDEFFAAGERASLPKEASGSYAAIDPRHAQKMTAHARARRAHLSRYVKWAVGAAAGILLLGVTIKTFRGRPNEEPVRHVVAHVSQPVEQPAPPPPPEKKKVAAPTPPPQVVAPAATEEAKAADSAKPADSAAPQASADHPADMPPEKPKTAWQEKQSAKAALERGANGAAVAAGERSVALDPSDAEAWLVLGAAYQAMGNIGQAKRSFHSCIAHGRKGPVSDCRDMLSSL